MKYFIKILMTSFIILQLFSCAAAPPSINLKYQVSTNTDPFKTINANSTYDIKLSNNPENEIVEKKMLLMVINSLNNKGFTRVTTNPDYIFSIDYSIDGGTTSTKTGSYPVTKSTYDYKTRKTTKHVTQQQYSNTSTAFERKINISAHTIKGELVWTGGIISRGSSQDVMIVAPHLIPQIIKRFGKDDIVDDFYHKFLLEDKGE